MIDQIESWKLLPVVAINRADQAQPLADALAEAGLPVAEITLRTDAGILAIASLADRENFVVGAGTVHTVDQAKQVADSGGKFIVTPGFNRKTVQWCLDNSMPIFPGVSSPTDLESAIELGVSVVKFFPAELNGGVKMLKAFQGPYGEIQFVPTGGINPGNVREYLDLPSVVACGGSWMVKSNLIDDGQFDEIKRLTAEAMALVN